MSLYGYLNRIAKLPDQRRLYTRKLWSATLVESSNLFGDEPPYETKLGKISRQEYDELQSIKSSGEFDSWYTKRARNEAKRFGGGWVVHHPPKPYGKFLVFWNDVFRNELYRGTGVGPPPELIGTNLPDDVRHRLDTSSLRLATPSGPTQPKTDPVPPTSEFVQPADKPAGEPIKVGKFFSYGGDDQPKSVGPAKKMAEFIKDNLHVLNPVAAERVHKEITGEQLSKNPAERRKQLINLLDRVTTLSNAGVQLIKMLRIGAGKDIPRQVWHELVVGMTAGQPDPTKTVSAVLAQHGMWCVRCKRSVVTRKLRGQKEARCPGCNSLLQPLKRR